MRTTEQIKNLRQVLIGVYGPVVLYASDDEINAWGDAYQNWINSIKHNWYVKLRDMDEKDIPFKDIEREPDPLRASKNQIIKKVARIMDKYPSIHSIEFVIVGSPNDVLRFERGANDG